MKSKLLACCLMGLAASACQPSDYVDPSDDPTGQAPPPATQVFAFYPASSPRFLDANLEASNALQAEFTVVNNALVPMQAGGAFPESAGVDADLLAGVGFGTYANPDRPAADWTAGSFKSVLEADVLLTQSGDAVRFCRSFATTCVTAQMVADGQGVLLLNLAANVPDVEIGEIAEGISAAVRGTGPNGLTIAITDPNVVAVPFAPAAGTPFELSWTIARGETPGSLDYAVSVDGDELASGNTAAQMSAAIATTGGVALMFDQPVAGGTEYEVDYSYSFENGSGSFDDVLGSDVNLSPQLGLAFAPLYVYPTLDPDFELLTLSGRAGAKHVVQPTDAVLGTVIDLPGEAPQARIYSTAFNGDDFADEGEAFAGVDQSIAGGGFYPSPALCYSQVFAVAKAGVEAGVRTGVHREMYATIANGVADADAALPDLATATGQTYTPLSGPDDYITIGTDYADSNVDMNIATESDETYTAVLNQPVSQQFVTELGAILTALSDSAPQPLIDLHAALTTPTGTKEVYDDNVSLVLRDVVNGINDTGENDPAEDPGRVLPVLAAGCLWGARPEPELPATPAFFRDPDPEIEDAPAYPAVPAQPAVAPAREQAAAQINDLIMGIYADFIGQVFGPEVPASNFSLAMEVGDTASGTAPAVSRIVISAQ